MEHTKGKWNVLKEFDGDLSIYPEGWELPGQECIAVLSLGQEQDAEANAQRIVDCVNKHDDIILALKCAEVDLCVLLGDYLGLDPEIDDHTDHPAIKTIHEIRQILASE